MTHHYTKRGWVPRLEGEALRQYMLRSADFDACEIGSTLVLGPDGWILRPPDPAVENAITQTFGRLMA